MKVISKKLSQSNIQTLVVFASKDETAKKASAGKLTAPIQKLLDQANKEQTFSGDKKETLMFRNAGTEDVENILFVGLGASKKLTAENLRVAAAVAYHACKSNKTSSAGILVDSFARAIKDSATAVLAVTEGLLLAAYEYADLKTQSKDDKTKSGLDAIVLLGDLNASQQKALKRGEILAECQNFSRRLGDSPGNYMNPTILANETVKAAKGTGLKVTVWDKARIKKERFGGLLAVAAGSDQEPRFIIMEYKGAAASKKPICFVGKGVTFDSGGISIKPGPGMEEMKYDMCGAAAVIGTMLAIARLKLKVNVIGLVPSTENLPGPSATKPGDVFFARNGKSVEVFNTDAEGRLILSDALSYGSEKKPAMMVDAATLTGAIMIALGNTHTGVFTRDEKLTKRIQTAADASGELVWFMPLTDDHVADMKGTHADLCNISGSRLAGSATAAAFLEQFVDKDIPWAHFDIAGTAWNVHNRIPYAPRKGASGVMVRTFVELAENHG